VLSVVFALFYELLMGKSKKLKLYFAYFVALPRGIISSTK